MRNVNAKFLAASLVVLLVPLAASATHIAAVDVHGDCAGWTVDVTVRYRSDVFEGDLDLVVQLTDLDGNVLEEQTLSAVVSREEGSFQTQLYSYNGEWTWYGPAGQYHAVATVTLTAVQPPGDTVVDVETRDPKFTCSVVTNEDTTWSSVKGLYR